MIQAQIIQTIAFNLIWQTALIAGVVYLGLKLLPNAQTKTRYMLSLSGLLGATLLLLLPFLPEFAPNLSIGLTPLTPADNPVFTPAFSPEITKASPLNITGPTIAQPNHLPPLGILLLGLWCIGIGFMLTRLITATWQAKLWRKQAIPISRLGTKPLSKTVTIRRSSHINAPMVLGLLRPVILVPEDFNTDFDSIQTRAVLEHEIAHITRGDLWVNFAQRLILALLWWCVPLYWLNTQIGIEREKLCDDIAAQKTGTGKALARALLDLAELHSRTSPPLLAIGIHPKTSHLADRVRRLYTGNSMIKISKKLLLTSSLAVPITLASLTLITPRAFAHNPFKDHVREFVARKNVTPEQQQLYSSAERGNLEAVSRLLTEGVNPNFVLHGDGTPLMVAVRRNDPQMVAEFIKASADVNLAAPGDGTPLIAAALSGNIRILTTLVNAGANVNHASPGDGNPLIAAAKVGNIRAAKALLAKGADINAVVPRDETPLINAAQQGNIGMVKFLIANGADINLGAWAPEATGRIWRTPLGEAKLHRHQLVAQYLSQNGARHETVTYDPKTNNTHTEITTYGSAKHILSNVKIVEGRKSSAFGLVRKGKVFNGKKHKGIDITNKAGTPIYAPADGKVLVFNEFSFRENYGSIEKYGKTIELETAGGVKTLFAHLQSFAVRQGAEVKAGDIIAYMGNTGVTTGPHVHIETHVNGDLVNPYEVWPNLR